MSRTPLILALGLAGLLALFIAVLTGSAPITLGETLAAVLGGASEPVRLIIWEIRLPRALTAFLVGASLGASGAVLQGLLRNPLADPGVLGVSAMSALGAVIVIYFGFASLHPLITPVAAILGAVVSVAVLYALGGGRVGVTQLILVGVGLSSFAGALTALAMNLAPNPFSLSDLVNWLLGSVANRSWIDIGFAAPFWIVGGALALLAAPGLRALSLGEDAALSLGADLKRTRLFAVLGAALLTGAAVAVAGVIGFVGIVAPHLVRPLVRHDPGDLIIPSALAAGAMLVLADIAVRLAPFSPELKIGVAAALVGAPAFVWIAATTRGFGR
ncbi:MAG: iron ABC transporter permease [Pseudomonadota bacterium]